MIYPKTFKDKKYPTFIQKSIFLKAFPKPTKIFPRIGLKNCEITLTAAQTKSISKTKKKLKICFSSDGNKGYWDIATMSMRGISSCMRWDSDHSKALVGSILDPYAGIIYITNDTNTKYGKKIIARAVVRFVVNNTNKPLIFIEKIYTATDNIYELNNIFKSFIKKKSKLAVISDEENNCEESGYYEDYTKYQIPLSEPIDLIHELFDGDNYLSLSDANLKYRNVKKFYDPIKVKI